MASSRIFVKGLPPTFTEEQFRQHFSQNGKRPITDAKLFPKRRIGYVGFRSAEDAQSAVKYFNKTFIRMSRIGVEIATPIDETTIFKGRSRAPTGKKDEENAVITPSTENKLKRKRDGQEEEKQDPKLKEFLEVMAPKSKRKAWEADAAAVESTPSATANAAELLGIEESESDDEYQQVERRPKVEKKVEREGSPPAEQPAPDVMDEDKAGEHPAEDAAEPVASGPVSDADWARSRTSRLLGLLDDDEEEEVAAASKRQKTEDLESEEEDIRKGAAAPEPASAAASIPTPSPETEEPSKPPVDSDVETVRKTMRLFIRNLPYDVQSADLEADFAPYGNLEEVHVPRDPKTGSGKGFAFVQYTNPDSAEQAFVERDGQIFQGRLIHILPSAAPRTSKLDDFELSKLPLKQQNLIKKKREAESKSFNWNSLYMNADAVVASVADRLGISKSEVLDPTSSDAAVRQAHAETHVIQETKTYFKSQGVDLDSFKKRQRGDTAILVKNIPYDVARDELKKLFDDCGEVKRFALPPSGGIAIVEFANSAQCKNAWSALAYRRVKNSVLLLEKAPKDVFSGVATAATEVVHQEGVNKVSATDLKGGDDTEVPETAGTATLFVRNLNFSTTTELLSDTFKSFEGFISARVKTKTDPKKPGVILSMGFGFLEFRSAAQAQVALRVMDGKVLEGHTLQIRASHKGNDAAEERRKADAQKKLAGRSTKVIIKNLPFEATKKDVRALFGAYGQLRSVRVPKKIDHSTRGFAFAEFMTPKEAQNAMEALRDTHLLGRRLVLDFASEDPADAEAEIEKMQQKIGAQANKVALQKLTSGGRKKFTTAQAEED